MTTEIIKEHGKWIAVEDLNIRGMTRRGCNSRVLNRSVREQTWGEFTQQLAYKALSAGGQLVKVDPKNTTQMCSSCGKLPPMKLTLQDRLYVCEHCGHMQDRDLNASRNIAQRGSVLLSGGLPDVRALCGLSTHGTV